MAETKQIGKLENLITFKTDKASLNQALASIKKVKDAMKAAMAPISAAKMSTKLDPALKRQREINRAHTKAIIEDRKRAQAELNKIQQQENREAKKSANLQNTLNNRNLRADRRAQATQEWFGSTFGRGGQRKATSLYNDMRSGKISAEQYATRLRSLRAELYRNQRAQRGFNQSIHDMRGAFIQATASYTAFAGVMGIANIGKQYEAQKAQMLVATGSREQAASQLDYLRAETYRLGLGREQASQGYAQIAMAGQADIGVEGVNKLFTGLSELATATKLEPFKYEKVVNAMGQMLAKKQIYSEEYQQQ